MTGTGARPSRTRQVFHERWKLGFRFQGFKGVYSRAISGYIGLSKVIQGEYGSTGVWAYRG